MKKWQKLIPYLQSLFEKEIPIEKCIPLLKEKGASQIETVYCLKKVFNVSIGKADELVLYSKCWKEKLETNIEVRDAFFDAFENYSEEE